MRPRIPMNAGDRICYRRMVTLAALPMFDSSGPEFDRSRRALAPSANRRCAPRWTGTNDVGALRFYRQTAQSCLLIKGVSCERAGYAQQLLELARHVLFPQ